MHFDYKISTDVLGNFGTSTMLLKFKGMTRCQSSNPNRTGMAQCGLFIYEKMTFTESAQPNFEKN